MKFKSKIDWWFYAVVVVMLAFTMWTVSLCIIEKTLLTGILGIIFIAVNTFVIIPIFMNTNYSLNESSLVVKCGLGKPLQIPYKNIIDVKNTKNFLASSALSLDRLEIKFMNNKINDLVFISPKDKEEFLKNLENKIDIL